MYPFIYKTHNGDSLSNDNSQPQPTVMSSMTNDFCGITSAKHERVMEIGDYNLKSWLESAVITIYQISHSRTNCKQAILPGGWGSLPYETM